MKQVFITEQHNERSILIADDFDQAIEEASRYVLDERIVNFGIPFEEAKINIEYVLPSELLVFLQSLEEPNEEAIEVVACSITRLIYYVSNLKEPVDDSILAGIQIYKNYFPSDTELPNVMKWLCAMEALVGNRFVSKVEYTLANKD